MLDIALGFDSRYARHARVVIESLLAAESAAEHPATVRLWLLTSTDVDATVRERIRSQVGDRAEVTFLEPTINSAGLGRSVNPDVAHVSEAMYLRLELPQVLPSDVRRVVYVDCDVLCTRSIAPLSTCDLSGRIIGAVRDAFTRRFSDTGFMPGLTGSGLSPKADYFNSGVLVIDLPAWRAAGITARCLDYLEAQRGCLRFPDQDALNVALYGEWLRLPKEWNYMMTWRLERAAAGNLQDATLIHSTGPVKHWHRSFPGEDLQKLYLDFRMAAAARLTTA